MIKATGLKDADAIMWSTKTTPGTNAQINPARHKLLVGLSGGNT